MVVSQRITFYLYQPISVKVFVAYKAAETHVNNHLRSKHSENVKVIAIDFAIMGSFLRRKSNYEHRSTVTANAMNTLMAIVTVFDIDAKNWICTPCEFRRTRPICLLKSELG